MTRINVNRLDIDADTIRVLREIAAQLNGLSEGRMSANYAARTSVPTTGTWNQGDKVRNSAPTELGVVTAKYVIDGWICTVAGTPGTWVQQHTLTGN